MKIFLLLTLGLALCSAYPQENEAKPRMRSPRRFALATPGLQSVNRAEAAANAAEEPVEQAAPVRGAPRGTSLPRRGRPTLRPRTSIQVEEHTEAQVIASRRDIGIETGRVGHQLRRPRTRVTTTTTTEAPPPIEEEPVQTKEEMTKEEMVMEDKMEKTVPVEKKMMEQVEETSSPMEKEMMEETKETVLEETATATEAPKPKLRPIPIKIGRRGQGVQRTPQLTNEEETPSGTPSETPAQRHRFTVASESGGSLRVRSRGRETGNSKTPPEETPSPATGGSPRLRKPTSAAQSTRISPRRTPVEEPVALEQEITDTENSSPNLNEIDDILNDENQIEVELGPSSSLDSNIDNQPLTTTFRTPEPLLAEENERSIPVTEIVPIEGSESETTLTPQEEETSYLESELALLPKVEEVVPILPSWIPSSLKITVVEPLVKSEAIPSRDIEVVMPKPKIEVTEAPDVEEAVPKINERFASRNNPRSSRNKVRVSAVESRGNPKVTLIGTVEDTPANELRVILSGLGSKRRGLGKPLASARSITPLAPTTRKLPPVPINEEDLVYDYYADLYEEEPIRKL